MVWSHASSSDEIVPAETLRKLGASITKFLLTYTTVSLELYPTFLDGGGSGMWDGGMARGHGTRYLSSTETLKKRLVARKSASARSGERAQFCASSTRNQPPTGGLPICLYV